MENQHRKIAGYRDLSKEEIDLMNQVKQKGAELLELQKAIRAKLTTDLSEKFTAVYRIDIGERRDDGEQDELDRFSAAEPLKWVDLGKTDIQRGVMALVRAIAQPADGS